MQSEFDFSWLLNVDAHDGTPEPQDHGSFPGGSNEVFQPLNAVEYRSDLPPADTSLTASEIIHPDSEDINYLLDDWIRELDAGTLSLFEASQSSYDATRLPIEQQPPLDPTASPLETWVKQMEELSRKASNIGTSLGDTSPSGASMFDTSVASDRFFKYGLIWNGSEPIRSTFLPTPENVLARSVASSDDGNHRKATLGTTNGTRDPLISQSLPSSSSTLAIPTAPPQSRYLTTDIEGSRPHPYAGDAAESPPQYNLWDQSSSSYPGGLSLETLHGDVSQTAHYTSFISTVENQQTPGRALETRSSPQSLCRSVPTESLLNYLQLPHLQKRPECCLCGTTTSSRFWNDEDGTSRCNLCTLVSTFHGVGGFADMSR